MRRSFLFTSLFCLLAVNASPALAGDPTPVVVEAHCDTGDDLAAKIREAERLANREIRGSVQIIGGTGSTTAANDLPRPIVVEIHGTCRTHLKIRTNDLTLRGAHDGAGIAAMTSSPVIEIRNAVNVELDNLKIDVIGTGIWSERASFRLNGTELVCPGHGHGIRTLDSTVRLTDSIVDYAGHAGTVSGDRASHFRFENSRLDAGLGNSISFLEGSTATFSGSEIAGGDPRVVVVGSRVGLFGTRLPAARLSASQGSHLMVRDLDSPEIRIGVTDSFLHLVGTISGPVNLHRSTGVCAGSSGVTGEVRMFQSSHFTLDSRCEFGRLSLEKFSTGSNEFTLGGPDVGTLTCDATSDLVCGAGATIGSSTCGSCPASSPAPASPVEPSLAPSDPLRHGGFSIR